MKFSFNKSFWKSGEPFVFASGLALSFILLLLFSLILIVLINGTGVFWPSSLELIEFKDGKKVLGEYKKDQHAQTKITKEITQKIQEGSYPIFVSEDELQNGFIEESQVQFKIGNRDLYGLDFAWYKTKQIKEREIYPSEAVVLEREEYGNFFGFLVSLDKGNGFETNNVLKEFRNSLKLIEAEKIKILSLQGSINGLTRQRMLKIERLKKLAYKNKANGLKFDELNFGLEMKKSSPEAQNAIDEIKKVVNVQHLELSEPVKKIIFEMTDNTEKFRFMQKQMDQLREGIEKYKVLLKDANGKEKIVSLDEVVRIYLPNKMSFFDKVWHYISKLKELICDNPREANTEGGLFPAIFGTIMMVFLMSILSFPVGCIAGIYLREYAKDGIFVRFVRIAVNNLAGIPSIVYGIFGLGFFVYFVGSKIDDVFFPHLAPTPYFGTGGILWASLTLGVLTVPVVIVATEEALSSIPKDIRQGSLALGATKFQTLCRVLLPMASPGILTGFILAMARAAGEVAPLMITGVVKLAPDLPLSGEWPFFHLDRKFMHLGFHIYDVGFQSPNVEAAKPMVYVTTLLLLLIVFILSLTAIVLRNKMKKKYMVKSF